MKEIQLTQGMVALVDDADFDYLNQWKWSLCKIGNNNYAARSKKIPKTRRSVSFRMHRIILDVPKGLYVDHIDGNGLNNQRSNLRICTNQDNARNQPARKNVTSQFKGVGWHKDHNKWRAYITDMHKAIHIGMFKSEKEAALAYDKRAKELFGEFARLNFPI